MYAFLFRKYNEFAGTWMELSIFERVPASERLQRSLRLI